MFKGVNRYDTMQHTCMYMDILHYNVIHPCMLFDSTLTNLMTNLKLWKKGLNWYTESNNCTNVTPCQRQHLIGWIKQHPNMIVHDKVSKLVKFNKLIPMNTCFKPLYSYFSFMPPFWITKHEVFHCKISIRSS